MYNGLLHAHSGLRWIALILIVITIINCLPAFSKNRNWSVKDTRLATFSVRTMHLMGLLGIVLYFISPRVQFSSNTMSNEVLRFFTVEHAVLMVLAIVLITIGNARGKKKATDAERFKSVFWFFLIGLLLLVAGIPWPFRELGAGWF